MLKNVSLELLGEWKMMSKKWKILIIFMVIAIITFIFLNTGCKSPSKIFVETNYKNGELMLEDLKAYIQKDKTLSAFDKTVRLRAIEEWKKMNTVMKEKYKEEK